MTTTRSPKERIPAGTGARKGKKMKRASAAEPGSPTSSIDTRNEFKYTRVSILLCGRVSPNFTFVLFVRDDLIYINLLPSNRCQERSNCCYLEDIKRLKEEFFRKTELVATRRQLQISRTRFTDDVLLSEELVQV